MIFCGGYIYSDLCDNVIYVGISINIKDRHRHHIKLKPLLKFDHWVQNNKTKYKLQIVELPNHLLNTWEEIMVNIYDNPKMLNRMPGGLAGRKGAYKITEETRQKMRDAKKNFIPWNKGRRDLPKHSEEKKKHYQKKWKEKEFHWIQDLKKVNYEIWL